MDSTKRYDIDLGLLKQGVYQYDFFLDDAFFTNLDQQEIHGGEVEAKVVVDVVHSGYMLTISVKGKVIVTCDRCLDDMEQEIDGQEQVQAKLTRTTTDDDIVAIDPGNGVLDLSWLLYELTEISLPIVHSHQQGECNPQMEELLLSHLCTTAEEPEDNL